VLAIVGTVAKHSQTQSTFQAAQSKSLIKVTHGQMFVFRYLQGNHCLKQSHITLCLTKGNAKSDDPKVAKGTLTRLQTQSPSGKSALATEPCGFENSIDV
jgi:hypothetical protein